MSAGPIIKSKYVADYQTPSPIHPIRVNEETETLSVAGVGNDPPPDDINNPISAVVSRGKRAKGLRPRLIFLRAPSTGAPTGYRPGGITAVPALNKEVYAAAEIATDATTVSYLGVTTFKVVSAIKEEAK